MSFWDVDGHVLILVFLCSLLSLCEGYAESYEQCYQALNYEMIGNVYHALHYMEWIVKENPLDEGIKKALKDMRERIGQES